jgi:hypothetical protein
MYIRCAIILGGCSGLVSSTLTIGGQCIGSLGVVVGLVSLFSDPMGSMYWDPSWGFSSSFQP